MHDKYQTPKLSLTSQRVCAKTEFRLPPRTVLQCWIKTALKIGYKPKMHLHALDVNIRYVDVAESAALNENYRQKCGATNILSFCYQPTPAKIERRSNSAVTCIDPSILNFRLGGESRATGVYMPVNEDCETTKPTPAKIERRRVYGDLVVCVPLVAREATAQQKDFLAHFAHLIIHGTLHLLGYDHQDALNAHLMEAKEILILDKMNIKNPY